jgi:hypothetical protein
MVIKAFKKSLKLRNDENNGCLSGQKFKVK